MKLQTAIDKLLRAYNNLNRIQKRIASLRKHIYAQVKEQNGTNNLVSRNKAIYLARKKGLSYKKIAEQNGLSTSTIGSICRRIFPPGAGITLK